MDAQAKTLWLEALRSGRFTQGHGMLVVRQYGGTGDQHCCLGVLAEVMGLPPGDWEHDELIETGMAESIGLNDDQQDKLATMNDGGDTFAEIADYIEANL